MTILNVNRERLSWLIRTALKPEELRRFFSDRRKALIIRGDPQNAPKNHPEAVSRLIRLPDSAHSIFGEWLRAETAKVQSFESDQLVPHFSAMEQLGLKLQQNALEQLARCGLLDLYGESPNQGWVEFLRTDISEAISKEVSPVPPSTELGQLTANQAAEFAAWAVNAGSRSAITHPGLLVAAELADAARSGDTVELSSRVSADVISALSAAYASAKARPDPSTDNGLSIGTPPVITADSAQDYHQYDVVAVTSRPASGGAWFLDVVAVLTPSGPAAFAPDERRKVFPDEGRVILFSDSPVPPPVPGLCDTYKVQALRTTKSIKFKAVDSGKRLHPIAYIPHASTDRDAVRDWLTEFAKEPRSAAHIFALSDGVCIKPRDGAGWPSTTSFDWTFALWKQLRGVELAHFPYALEPLPPASSQYECAPASAIARRAIKALNDQRGIKLTKAQLTELSTALSDPALPLLDAHRARILAGLAALGRSDEHFAELISVLKCSPDVEAELRKARELVAEEARSELARERTVLKNLQSEITSSRQRLEKLKAEEEAQVREIRQAVKRAFQSAGEKEAETLGQLALWRELLSFGTQHRATPQRAESDAPASIERFSSLTELRPSRQGVAAALEGYGLPPESTATLEEVIRAACDVGVPILIEGSGANNIATTLARSLCSLQCACLDVPVGLIARSRELEHARQDPAADILLIRSANLSDMAMYADTLLLVLLERSTRGSLGAQSKLVVVSAANGPARLRWPSELLDIALLIDVSQPTLVRPGEPTPIGSCSPIRQKIWTRLELAGEKRNPNGALTPFLSKFFGVAI